MSEIEEKGEEPHKKGMTIEEIEAWYEKPENQADLEKRMADIRVSLPKMIENMNLASGAQNAIVNAGQVAHMVESISRVQETVQPAIAANARMHEIVKSISTMPAVGRAIEAMRPPSPSLRASDLAHDIFTMEAENAAKVRAERERASALAQAMADDQRATREATVAMVEALAEANAQFAQASGALIEVNQGLKQQLAQAEQVAVQAGREAKGQRWTTFIAVAIAVISLVVAVLAWLFPRSPASPQKASVPAASYRAPTPSKPAR